MYKRQADRRGGEGFPAGVRAAPDRCGGFSHLVRNFPYLCGSFQNRGAFLKQEGFSPFNQPSSCLLLMHKGGTDTFYRIRTALFSLYSSKVLMASMVSVIRSSRLQPSISAPCSITSREQPAAKLFVLNFFFTDFSSRSCTLLEGRISAAAPIRPVS